MITKLKIRFTAVIMAILAAVMLAVVCAVYGFMHRSEIRNTDRMMDFVQNITREESFPFSPPAMPQPDSTAPDVRIDPPAARDFPRINEPHENEFSSGWVRISLDSEGNTEGVFYSQNITSSEQESRENAVITAAEQITAKNERDGTVTADGISYRYRYSKAEQSIILIDRTGEISTMNRLLAVLVGIYLLSLIPLFIISMLLAKWAAVPIEDAWNRQKIFFSNASHELKTPLTVISANLDVITANPDETVKSQKKWFGFIRDESQKMSVLINQMLYLSKEEQNTAVNKVSFDLSKATESACLSMDAVAFEKGRSIFTEIEKNISYCGDKESICRMINILIDNAINHSAERTEITVSLKSHRNKIKLRVANKGVPIPAAELERIFDRYYRTDSSRSLDTGGFGLGLAIAKTIAENHKGQLTASSDENETVFSAVL